MSICGFANILNKKITEKKLPSDLIDIKTLLIRNPGFTGSTFIIKKECFKEIGGFDENLYTSNDKDFFIRFIQNNKKFCVVSETLVYRDDSLHDRLTQVSVNKISSTEYFFKKYSSLMDTNTKKEYVYKIKMLKTLKNKSLYQAILLLISNIKKYRTSLSILKHILINKDYKI
jgi:GT2 family glycosyltransferase